MPPAAAEPLGLPPLEDRVGVREDTAFAQHWSVEHWRSYSWPPPGANLTSLQGANVVASEIAKHAQAAQMLQDAQSAAYWAYHMARSAFYVAQSGASVLLHAAVSGQLRSGRSTLATGQASMTDMLPALLLRLPGEAMAAFEQDLRNIKAGAYKLPWDMTTPGHRQANPVWVARQSVRYLQEAVNVLTARSQPQGNIGKLPYGPTNLYPNYYQNNFHFQSDGWFSSKSAGVYEVATESLFLGRQDAMQRSTLIPINRHFPGSKGEGLKMLEVGAGTGRFATYVRDNLELADLTVTELSPFYLQEARDNMSYWQRRRGGSSGSGGAARTTFVQCAAESLPFADASMDIVYSVYLFHEMPDAARDAALREMARVLKPGGLLVVTDSKQFGDRPRLDANSEKFGGMNEPFFASYLRYSFADAFAAVGLRPDYKVLQSVTKTLSAIKPK